MRVGLKQKLNYFASISILLAGTLLFSSFATAATIRARPLSTKIDAGGNFTVSVDVDTQGKTINNAEAVISFPADLVEVTSINSGGSIFSLWVEPATFSNNSGTISFNGGVPNPGYTGSSGHLLSIQFHAKNSGTAQFTFDSAAIRENDGLGTNILSGQTGGTISITEQATTAEPVTPETPITPTTQTVIISSPTHPDSTKWYNLSQGMFIWKLPAGVTASQTSLDKTSGTIPRVLRKPAVSSIPIPEIQDGVWYFNARFLSANGWSKISSYKIQVDTVVPNNVTIHPASETTGRTLPTISGSDQLSGIDYFLVQIDDGQEIQIAPTGNETEIRVPGIIGTHMVTVTAYDKAGNTAVTKANIEFVQPQKLAITKFTKTVKEGGRIEADGTGPANSQINILLLTEDGISRTYTVASKDDGTFSFRSEPLAATGSYTIWAEALSAKGNNKLNSEHLTITVQASILAKLNNALKSSARLITTTNIIILLLSLLSILGWMNYFALKRRIRLETILNNPPKRYKKFPKE